MGLAASTLTLDDWRNFGHLELAPSPGMTILHGQNAAGKTNVVEALQLLTAGVSFRRPRATDLVRDGALSARAALTLTGDGRVVDMVACVADGKRSFALNGKRCAAADVPRTLMSVLFNPDDLSFVKRGAACRRDELDGFGRQANRGYGRLLAAYQRAIEQRNHLLKEERPDLSMLAAWDASVAAGGAALLSARLRLFCRLRDHLVAAYGEIAPGERLTCAYESSLGGEDELVAASREGLVERLMAALGTTRQESLRRQQTTVGPQRDEMTFHIDGRDARAFGSQGQQRSIVLAWKMAEVSLAHEIVGQPPLLLLDDVMSELDARRRETMTRFVQDGVQTVVTTTNLGYFPQELLDWARVVHIGP